MLVSVVLPLPISRAFRHPVLVPVQVQVDVAPAGIHRFGQFCDRLVH
jgi:hypothetical protein